MGQETTFYEDLQKIEGLDLRDNRGKRHEISLLLLSFTIALFRKRDGNLSSIWRSIKNKQKDLCNSLSIDYVKYISRSQLPKVLEKISREKFQELLYRHYGIELDKTEEEWFAGDVCPETSVGKDLKGSILKGDKRGEAQVQIVGHQSRKTVFSTYYSGKKESEKTYLRELIELHQAESKKYTFDALHLSPATTSMIAQEKGTYIIGLKDNQSILLEPPRFRGRQMCLHSELEKPAVTVESTEKGHGRIEERCYKSYDVSEIPIEDRWEKSDIKTLIRVERKFTEVKTNKVMSEISFYITNGSISNSKEYFKAIRNHWSCEVNHHIRDVTLQEDKFRTKFPRISRNVAAIRTLIVNILLENKPKNMAALLERFQDDFNYLMLFLKQINFL